MIISIYDIEVENDQLVGVLSRRSINKHSRSVTLLSYQNHVRYMKYLNAVFICFRCGSCNKLFRKHSNLRRHLPICSEKVKEKFPKSAYQLKETVFEKFSKFGITVPEDYRLFKNLAIVDFESICVTENNSESSNSTTWVGKHQPISVSISSNLLENPIFLCDPQPIKVITQFVDALGNLANESRDQMQSQFADKTSAVHEKLEELSDQITLNESGSMKRSAQDVSRKFLNQRKRELLNLQETLENYLSTFPVFVFNSGKYDLNLIKSFNSNSDQGKRVATPCQ